MLHKPPKNLNSLIDLQEDLQRTSKQRWTGEEDAEMIEHDKDDNKSL